ncbi:MAG: glucose dehydrogenase [Candidatus Nephthysia bennettiae]|uniref:Glucose 1-dehydrogenase n=1 Tax=Candidatus Nephthysia bennettiae TaxID=3127016 RepID=A0A934N4R9_9BACT|nr:glucose 1-dehydrogenase [Candidatus Dormibacteraeota bacterium]MBJ7611446.1 glucose 1-dehydrogenase [Candidatus Dormibacteraeota bacterium]PZR95371.1 MAG: glucose dehydrogenase [Candidatus Dormibacteraeota bacterium]
MKAIAVIPGQAGSVHLAELPRPRLNEIPEGRGVLVRVLSVGLDGTDKEINAASYGAAPPGSRFLVLGHESLGVVEQVGPGVTEVQTGDRVVATVRRPGNSLYDSIGLQDFTTDDTYHEHGISTLHGFLTEYYVDDARYLVKVPVGLGEAAVLLEPTSVAEKGIAQAFEIQRRLRVWSPRRAAVLGAGPLGLLATMILRLRGLQVTTLGLDEPPYLNSEMAEALGARYLSTRKTSLARQSEQEGPFDLIFEATGFSPLVFEAMGALAKNGVLVLSSVTGGDRQTEVPADRLNLGFVLGNKVMVGTVNASRADFEAGVRDLAMMHAQDPDWLQRFITHRVRGLDGYPEAFEMLNQRSGTIKVVVEVAPEESRMQAAGMLRSTRASG